MLGSYPHQLCLVEVADDYGISGDVRPCFQGHADVVSGIRGNSPEGFAWKISAPAAFLWPGASLFAVWPDLPCLCAHPCT